MFKYFLVGTIQEKQSSYKLHTQFDVKTEIPTFIQLSDGETHDVNILDFIEFEKDAFYVMDKAYISFKRLDKIRKAGAYFVTRAQVNQDFHRLYTLPVDK